MGAGTRPALPAAFWDIPAVQDSLDHRDLGALFALILEYSTCSQHSLAAEVGISQTQIWHYIHERHKPTLDTVARVASRLNLPSQARLRLGLSAAEPGAAPPKIRLSRVLALAEYIGRTGDTSGLASWRETASTGTADDTWEHLSRLISVQPPPNLQSTHRMSVRTRGFFTLAAKLPARLLIQALTAHVNDVGLLLDAINDPAQRRELASIGGESSYLAACCDVDLGDLAQALNRLDVISTAARAAADSPLAAIALDGQSHFHAFRGHHERALDFVEQGLQKCTGSDSPGTVAFMHMRVAEEHLALDHRTRAIKAWAAAEHCYATTNLETDRNWLRLWFTRDCFDSVRAVIYASTGRNADAIDAAERVVTRVDGARGKSDAVALLNAATALGAVGRFGPAAEAGRCALQATRASEARGCLPRAESLAKLLASRRKQDSSISRYIDDFEVTQDKLANMPHPTD